MPWGGKVSTSFKPGQSGNPAGRSKASREARELARSYSLPAIEKLAEMAGLTDAPAAESETARIQALNSLLDRGIGKAPLVLEGDEDAPIAIHFTWGPAHLPDEVARPVAPPAIEAAVQDDAASDNGADEEVQIVWGTDIGAD
jgi:hypothetical protein